MKSFRRMSRFRRPRFTARTARRPGATGESFVRARFAGTARLAGVLLAVHTVSAFAVEPRAFPTADLSERYRVLVEEIRCLVCQNQTIADSNADLARDLRDKVDEMLRAGRSDDEILDYLVDRYGNFVRYRPPLDPSTALLWLGPFALAAAALVWLVIRTRRHAPVPERLSGTERTRLARIVGSGDRRERED